MANKGSLAEVASVFFKLGCVAFGGPAAHIAMMEAEIVEKRKWMTRQHFLDLIGATNLIPGPNSTEMTMHCGHERAGWKGLFVAGASFIVPAIVITGFLAWLYVKYGSLPEVEPFLYGIKPAVLALIAQAIFKLGKKALKNWQLGVLGALTIGACLLGVSEVVALIGAGVLGMIVFSAVPKSSGKLKSVVPILLAKPLGLAATGMGYSSVFLTFLKVGAILYGSGYVLFAYLDAELVATGWMTAQELLDAIAVGQFTPGPVLSTATFVGYQLKGFQGALAASAGIFLPSFLFVLLLNPLIPKMQKSKVLRQFLNSVNVAAVAVMVSVLITMSIETLIDWRSITIGALGFAVMFGLKKKVNPMLLIASGAVLGYLLQLVG